MKRFVLATVSFLSVGVLFASSTASAVVAAKPRYAALGDSVAAGYGLPVAANASAEDRLCGRSTAAYPYQVATGLNMTLQHLACTGAKADEGLYGVQNRNGTRLTPQLTTAFAPGRPDLITITIGANDARWTQFIRDCYVWRCGSTWDDARAVVYRADLKAELIWTLYKIRTLSNGNPPKVLMNGYYAPFAAADCAEKQGKVTVQEVAWLNKQVGLLNQSIQNSAGLYSFARFVPVSFAGHELCSTQPWVQGLAAAGPFHPTAAGQTAIAGANLTAYRR